MQSCSVYGKAFPNGHRTLTSGTHIKREGTSKSLCGKQIASIQPGDPQRHADCQRCRNIANL